MDKQQLMQLLPHRDPMLLLDEAELDGDLARGKRLIRGDEWFLTRDLVSRSPRGARGDPL